MRLGRFIVGDYIVCLGGYMTIEVRSLFHNQRLLACKFTSLFYDLRLYNMLG